MDVPPLDDSALALRGVHVAAGQSHALGAPDRDTLVYVTEGTGALTVAGADAALRARTAGLVLAGEEAQLAATEDVEAVVVSVAGDVDLHAPMGAREHVVALDEADPQQATGARSFQILFGPHNGSTRATLFAGYIPPGKAPWHYHLYDEIVWVPSGPGRLHVAGGEELDLEAGTAFRLRPRQVHIVENLGDAEMTIIGVFTPAGSPSAAYLTPEVAGEYRFAS